MCCGKTWLALDLNYYGLLTQHFTDSGLVVTTQYDSIRYTLIYISFKYMKTLII